MQSLHSARRTSLAALRDDLLMAMRCDGGVAGTEMRGVSRLRRPTLRTPFSRRARVATVATVRPTVARCGRATRLATTGCR